MKFWAWGRCTGYLSDAYGRRWMMLISLFGASLGYFIFGSGGALAVLFTGWLIVGLTDGTASMAFAAIADTTTPQQRTRAFSWVSGMMALGLIIGPVVSGVLSGIHPTLPVYVVAIAFVIALVWRYFAMPETLPPSQRYPQPDFSRPKSLAIATKQKLSIGQLVSIPLPGFAKFQAVDSEIIEREETGFNPVTRIRKVSSCFIY